MRAFWGCAGKTRAHTALGRQISALHILRSPSIKRVWCPFPRKTFCSVSDPSLHRTYRSGVPRVLPSDSMCNAKDGLATWNAPKSLWHCSHAVCFAVGAVVTTTDCAAFLEGFAVFFTTTGVSVLFGHSLGMHRLWIHRAYETSKPMEYGLVHLGTIMGIAGPLGMRRSHDLRDWAQRQIPGECHVFYSQQSSFWKDTWLQLHCDIDLHCPPEYDAECDDPVILWMEKWWRWQQIPWVVGLGLVGGPLWITWGVFARTLASTYGHFFVGWFAHNSGHIQSQNFAVDGVACQGYNVQGWPLIGDFKLGQQIQAVMCAGENYHANHHAFPGSARFNVEPHEIDIGFCTLKLMEKVGLVWNIKEWKELPPRAELVDVRPPRTM